MTDVFEPAARSAVMRAVRSRDTSPEIRVRRAAHALGLRYRLHRNDLPGKPDLVFVSRRVALFVHGCFWHGHTCTRGARKPKANARYWSEKIARNMARDRSVLAVLEATGWRTMVIWECETHKEEGLRDRLIAIAETPSCSDFPCTGVTIQEKS